MLKFAGKWDAHSNFRPKRRNPIGDKTGDFDIPTVDEVDAFNAESDANTIRQILSNEIAAINIYFCSDVEETRGRRIKTIPAQHFLDAPKLDSAGIRSKKIRLDISARSHAERTMLEHWKLVERQWLAVQTKGQVKLTSRQRIFYHACICGGYNRESALALAKQFVPSKLGAN